MTITRPSNQLESAHSAREDAGGGAGGGSDVAGMRTDTPPQPVLRERVEATPTRQFSEFVLAPVALDELAGLHALLAQIGRETIAQMQGRAPPTILPLCDVRGLHFARFVVLDSAEEGVTGKVRLAFALDYDGIEGVEHCSEERARRAFEVELFKHTRDGLHRVFSHCMGFSPLASNKEEQLSAYFSAHRLPPATAFVGAPGRSVRQIRYEAQLRRDVERVLQEKPFLLESPEQVRHFVIAELAKLDPSGVIPFPAQPDLEAEITKVRRRVLLGAAATVGLTFVSGGVPGLIVLCAVPAAMVARFRYLERTDAQFEPVLNRQTHEAMSVACSDENWFLQNQLSHVVAIKPGWLRERVLDTVFWLLHLLAENRYNRGDLGGIPSIHFARWVKGPERKIIFLSNFDSSWQSYLGDFIDKASSGLTAVWSNTVGYPRTTWLREAGSRDAGRFLAWTRAHQVPSQVWYSAYPGLSVSNVNANTELRRGLASPEEIDAVSWLQRMRNVDRRDVERRYAEAKASALAKVVHTPTKQELIEQAARVASPLPLDDIQGLILKGYGHKPEARYLLFQISETQKAPAIRRWLSTLPVTSASAGTRDQQAPDPLLNVAFTYRGMLALGLEQQMCDSFATAFVQGSEDPGRARINGDIGEDDPSNWRWGAGSNVVHFAILLFASDRSSLMQAVTDFQAEQQRVLGAGTLRLVESLEATTLPDRKEHFGFRDGIAQPVVQGSGDEERGATAVAAGEFLLGHRDGYGNVAQLPESSQGFDFGMNGSYMVLRQLEQDVPAFWRACQARADSCAMSPLKVASKMVGRWPSGAPLVRAPDGDPNGKGSVSNEDDFGYFEVGESNDRYGSKCPFGAHIRRANPRDWGLGEDVEESKKLSGLHRIMRRGRPYGPPLVASMDSAEIVAASLSHDPGPSAERGLQFIAFNANLERQFEFVQQQWCKNPKFAGQQSDADPLLGIHHPPGAIAIEDPGFTLQSDASTGYLRRLIDLERFVRVRGSGYFFMPSLSALRLFANHLSEDASDHTAERYEKIPLDEQVHIDRLIDNIRLMLARFYPDKPTLRDAHPKLHGCVKAVLIPDPKRARDLRHGLFAEDDRVYRAWARFSNEHQHPRHDRVKDTRGLALKLCAVPGKKLLDGEEDSATHDFIFLSAPAFVTHDVAEFDELLQAVVHNQPSSWLRSIPVMLRLFASRGRYGSPLEVDYYSVVPSLLGPTPVKYSVIPSDPKRTRVPLLGPANFLRQTLKRQLAERSYEFDVFVQRFVDEHTTPIEDPSVLWPQERAPRERIATLRIIQQDDFDTKERDAFGDALAFNPYRCLPQHRPIGGINRARRQVYRAISSFRRTRNKMDTREPESW